MNLRTRASKSCGCLRREPTPFSLPNRIRAELNMDSSLTQSQLAYRLGVSKQRIGQVVHSEGIAVRRKSEEFTTKLIVSMTDAQHKFVVGMAAELGVTMAEVLRRQINSMMESAPPAR